MSLDSYDERRRWLLDEIRFVLMRRWMIVAVERRRRLLDKIRFVWQ